MAANPARYGSPNPGAPPQLARFAFLIGTFRGEARLRREDGTWERLDAMWEGRWILHGQAIADEFRMSNAAGELLVLGVNLRAWDAQQNAWSMKWLNALAGTWTDLGPAALGGVHIDDDAIVYCMEEPVADHALTRATYTGISNDRFIWRGERSSDGATWEEFLVIELERVTA